MYYQIIIVVKTNDEVRTELVNDKNPSDECVRSSRARNLPN